MNTTDLTNALKKGDRLMGMGQFGSAIIYFNQLKSFYDAKGNYPLEKILIEIEIAWTLEAKGNYEESQELFLQILEKSLLINDPNYDSITLQKSIISIYHGLSRVDIRLENIESAFIWAQKAVVESVIVKDAYLIAESNYYLASVHYYIGQSDKIITLLDESIDIIRKGDPKLLGQTLILYGLTYQMTGDLDKSMTYLSECQRIYENMSDFKNLSICLNNLAVTYRLKGEYQKSLRLLKKVEIITEDQGNWYLGYHVVDNITEILLLTGEINQAKDSALRLIQIARNNHFQTLIGKALGILAQIEQHTNLQIARDLFEEAIILLQTSELEAYLIECVNRYLSFLIRVEDFDNALLLLNKYEKIIDDKQLNVYKPDFLLNRGLIESYQNLNLGLAQKFYLQSLESSNQYYSSKIKSYIYLAENALESYQIRPKGTFLQRAKDYIALGYEFALTRKLYPDIASINLIKALLAQITEEMEVALKIIDDTLALTRNKGLKLQEAQANALKSKLIEKQKSMTFQHLQSNRNPVIQSEFDSTRALISTIRIFYHEDFSHIMPHENQLSVVYYSLSELGPIIMLEDFSEIGKTEYKLSKSSTDEILLLMGSSYSIAVGQGNNYQEGLFGPLPVPRLMNTFALVYSKDLSNKEPVQNLNQSTKKHKKFVFLCFLYPKQFDTLFFNRELLIQEFTFFIDKFSSHVSEMNLAKWKTELLKSVQTHYIPYK